VLGDLIANGTGLEAIYNVTDSINYKCKQLSVRGLIYLNLYHTTSKNYWDGQKYL
jgi:hypothetical protein